MKSKYSILLLAAILLSVTVPILATPPAIPPNPNHQLTIPIMKMAHFCNWHTKTARSSSWPSAQLTPIKHSGDTIGYDSDDPEIIHQQNEEMYAAGITPLISWWGPTGTTTANTGDLFLNNYLAASIKYESKTKFGILYEVTGRLHPANPEGTVYDVDDPDNQQIFLDDIQHLSDLYLSQPQYQPYLARIQDRPIIFIWLSHALEGNFEKVVAQARQSADFYLIGSNFNLGGASSPESLSVIRAFDAISAYSIIDPTMLKKTNNQVNDAYIAQYKKALYGYATWLRNNAPQTAFIAPVSFTYHEPCDYLHNCAPGHSPLIMECTPENAYKLLTITQQFINAAYGDCSQTTNILPATIIVSYNEDFEKTGGLEPSDPTFNGGFGTTFLDAVRQTLGPPIIQNGCPPPGHHKN